jgi:hypothetical protein
VNAGPQLARIAAALDAVGLEAVLVGLAAAALQGAPVTTLDFDFMFRKTRANLRKLRALADRLGGTLLRPYYPVSDLYRLVDEDTGLQIDFMARLHGIRSFASLRSRATTIELAGHPLRVADLADIITSKRAADRPRDRAVLPVLDATLREKKASQEG